MSKKLFLLEEVSSFYCNPSYYLYLKEKRPKSPKLYKNKIWQQIFTFSSKSGWKISGDAWPIRWLVGHLAPSSLPGKFLFMSLHGVMWILVICIGRKWTWQFRDISPIHLLTNIFNANGTKWSTKYMRRCSVIYVFCDSWAAIEKNGKCSLVVQACHLL